MIRQQLPIHLLQTLQGFLPNHPLLYILIHIGRSPMGNLCFYRAVQFHCLLRNLLHSHLRWNHFNSQLLQALSIRIRLAACTMYPKPLILDRFLIVESSCLHLIPILESLINIHIYRLHHLPTVNHWEEQWNHQLKVLILKISDYQICPVRWFLIHPPQLILLILHKAPMLLICDNLHILMINSATT